MFRLGIEPENQYDQGADEVQISEDKTKNSESGQEDEVLSPNARPWIREGVFEPKIFLKVFLILFLSDPLYNLPRSARIAKIKFGKFLKQGGFL